MDPAPTFRVTYWGVTGSYPRPCTAAELQERFSSGNQPQRTGGDPNGPVTYGGDTTCVQIEAGDELFIVDAGSGLRLLSQWLTRARGGQPSRGTLLLTHAHFDHLCALPFFEPFYEAQADFTLRAAPRVLTALERIGQAGSDLAGVFLPQTIDQLPGLRRCEAIEGGESFTCGDAHISTYALHHPGGSLAYRFERRGVSMVIATDHEQPESPDQGLAEFARGAALLYMDAHYLRREYDGQAGIGDEPPRSRVGWGHSAIEDCLPTALAAGVGRLHLGHHEPRRTDAMLDELGAYVRELGRRQSPPLDAQLAYQGLTVEI